MIICERAYLCLLSMTTLLEFPDSFMPSAADRSKQQHGRKFGFEGFQEREVKRYSVYRKINHLS